MQDPALDQLIPVANTLLSAAADRFERRVLVLSGDAERMRFLAGGIASRLQSCVSTTGASLLWVGAIAPTGMTAVPASKAVKMLGREHRLIVYDAHAGFHPDAFCAVLGTLTGGGLLLLLTPRLSQWQQDVDYLRMLPYGYALADNSSYFLARVAQGLLGCQAITVWDDAARAQAGAVLPAPSEPPVNRSSYPVVGSHLREQDNRLQTLQAFPSNDSRVCVITADRGRGKTALLGRAAAHWLVRSPLKLAVTSSMPSAAQQVLAWVQREAVVCGAPHAEASLRFVAPDALLQSADQYDVLLIDEAAMLPVSVLQSMIERFPRVVLASTVHGYEGSGRGLAIKLFPWLDRERPGWVSLQMRTPIRWAEGDPIERWQSDLFCLGDELPELPSIAGMHSQVREVSGKLLHATPSLLHSVFSLLVSAHYRTTPSDLRDLLDGPNLRLWVQEVGGHVAGVCLVAMEGGFTDDALCDAIMAGARRPRGHLLPQILAFHCDSPVMLRARCARVVRIAITPPLQGRGWGGKLLSAVARALAAEGTDVLGSSFALEPPVLRFWQQQGQRVLRVGASRESASGLPSCLVARPLAGAPAALVAELEALHRQFCREAVRTLPVGLTALNMQCGNQGSVSPNAGELPRLRSRINRFVAGSLPIESALGALWQVWPGSEVVRCALQTSCWQCSVDAGVLALNDWVEGRIALADFVKRTGALGRDDAIASIRRVFGMLDETERLRYLS